jgi:hypothetical protein
MDYHEFFRYLYAGEPVLTVDDFADAIESLLDEMDRFIETLEQEREARMGAFDTVANITIPNPDDREGASAFRKKWKWDAHEQIIIKGQFTANDQEIMENASSAIKGQGKKSKFDVLTGSARRKLLELMIVDWTLTQDGKVLPVSSENVGKLPANYRTPILEQCDEIAMTMSEEEQEDFLPGANGHTSASLGVTK